MTLAPGVSCMASLHRGSHPICTSSSLALAEIQALALPPSLDAPSYTLARETLEGRGAFAATATPSSSQGGAGAAGATPSLLSAYDSDSRSLHLSMKLFNRTPADLPPDLKDQVGGEGGKRKRQHRGLPCCVCVRWDDIH